jgi:hypothetical protein
VSARDHSQEGEGAAEQLGIAIGSDAEDDPGRQDELERGVGFGEESEWDEGQRSDGGGSRVRGLIVVESSFPEIEGGQGDALGDGEVSCGESGVMEALKSLLPELLLGKRLGGGGGGSRLRGWERFGHWWSSQGAGGPPTYTIRQGRDSSNEYVERAGAAVPGPTDRESGGVGAAGGGVGGGAERAGRSGAFAVHYG